MKLTDLNIDCLESILEYLTLQDFLSAATSNARIRKAAKFIFVRKTAKRRFYISVMEVRPFRYWNSIHGVRTALLLLRCFGHLVAKIYFLPSGEEQLDLDQHVINYISEYCSGSLTSITIQTDCSHLKFFQKPFHKVEEVTLNYHNVANKDTLNRLFPNMQKLTFTFEGDEQSFLDHSNHSNHYPNLKELILSKYFPNGEKLKKLDRDTIAPILLMNPQIRILTFFGNILAAFESNDFENAIRSLKDLQEFTFCLGLSTIEIDTMIHLNNVHTVDIDALAFSNKIPFLFGQLNKLVVKFWCSSTAVIDRVLEFIDEHPTIRYLTLSWNTFIIHLPKVAKSLPLLASITFTDCKISTDDAIDVLSMFQNLEHFKFAIDSTSIFDEFRACLSNEWECKMENDIMGNEIIEKYINVERIELPMAKKPKKTLSVA